MGKEAWFVAFIIGSMTFPFNMTNITDECVKMKLHSIEETLLGILATSPMPNGNDSSSDTYSPLPHTSQNMRTLADSLEQAMCVGLASRTLQDKAVGTETEWQAKPDSTWLTVPFNTLPHIDILHHLQKVFAVAGSLSRVVIEHLPNTRAVAQCHLAMAPLLKVRVVVAIAVISVIFYGLSTYTLQEDIIQVY